MPFFLGIHVWLEVEGRALPEYKHQLDQRRTTCFIASQEGKVSDFHHRLIGLPMVHFSEILCPFPESGTCRDRPQGKRIPGRFEHHQWHLTSELIRCPLWLGMAAGSGMLLARDTHAAMLSGQARREGFESPFLFARLKTTDDESEACRNENRLQELGTIRVCLVRSLSWSQV